MIVGLMFLGLVALILLNVPIAIALGVVAMGAMVWSSGMDSLLNAAIVMFTGATSFPLLAIPLFILAGAIMNSSSLSRRLIAFASALFGFVRGGLAMITIRPSMFFAAIPGSAGARGAATGPAPPPALPRRRAPPGAAWSGPRLGTPLTRWCGCGVAVAGFQRWQGCRAAYSVHTAWACMRT